MEGTRAPGNALSTNAPGAAQRRRAVVLTSRAWGHEGGNALTAEFVKAPTANSALRVR